MSDVTPLKILLILPSNQFGGAENVALNVLKGLKDDRCTLVTQEALSGFFTLTNASIIRFEDFDCHRPYDLSPLNALRYAIAIARITRRVRPDIVLGLMHNGTFFASLGFALKRMRCSLIGSIHGDISGYFNSLKRGPTPWERWLIRLSISVPQQVIVPSKGVYLDLIDSFGAEAKKLSLIPNGVDLVQVLEAASTYQEMPPKDRPWILTACRLSPQKDFLTLLRAFSLIVQDQLATLIIVGEGESRTMIESWIQEMGLQDHVVLLGFQENPFPMMAQADVLVLSSFYEGFGVSIIEGFALGIPQVVSNCPSGPADLIQEGVNGFLVEIGDWEGMAARCLDILKDPNLSQRIKEAARLSAQHYAIDLMVSRYKKLFDDVRTPSIPSVSSGWKSS